MDILGTFFDSVIRHREGGDKEPKCNLMICMLVLLFPVLCLLVTFTSHASFLTGRRLGLSSHSVKRAREPGH